MRIAIILIMFRLALNVWLKRGTRHPPFGAAIKENSTEGKTKKKKKKTIQRSFQNAL